MASPTRRSKARYYIETWDMDKQEFTPQVGVRTGPYSLFGLRKAIRKLQGMGYSAAKGDPCTYIYSVVNDKEVTLLNSEA